MEGEQSSAVVTLLPDHVARASAAGVPRCAGLQGSSPAQTVPGKLTTRVGGMEKLLCKEELEQAGFSLEKQPVGKAEC